MKKSIFRENSGIDNRLLKRLENLCKRIFFKEEIPQYSIDPIRLLDVISELSLYQKKIIILRYGLENFLKPQRSRKTLKECSEELNTTQHLIRKNLNKAIVFLKKNKHRYYYLEEKKHFEVDPICIEKLALSSRAYNALKRNGIDYVYQVENLNSSQIAMLNGIGTKLSKEIWNAIHLKKGSN